MSTYLLLRDNKQSGPYSTEELLAKGLKAYDLVWLEGKSAAWRYPSELSELKPYAPTVEEQPYDRFYKKPAAEQSAAEPAATQVSAPVKEKEAARTAAGNAAPGKVYVTMPVAAGNVAAMRKQSVAVAMPAGAQKTSAEPVTPKDTPRKTIAEQPAPLAAAIAAQPAVQDTPAASRYGYDTRTVNTIAKTAAGKNRMLLNMIAAACLLLGGVVIGLAISNNQRKEDKSNLEKMAQVIAGHSQNKQASTVPVQPTEPPAENHAAVAVENKITPATDSKTDRPVKNKTGEAPTHTEALPVTETATVSTQTSPKEEPVNITNTETEKNVSPLDETAAAVVRQQLHRQVSVAAGTYKTGILGGISNLNLTVTNSSHYPLDEVAVEVKYLGPEKRVVKTQTVLFNDIAAGEQKTQEAPRSNRGVSIDYAIITIYSRALGLAKGF